jgi:hypothetical protein
MKDRRANKTKMRSNSIKGGGQHKTPNRSVPWGRAASPHRPGLFAKQYLEERSEGCVADIYRRLSDQINLLNKERILIGEKPFRRPNFGSFSRYFHWFLLLGLVERTGKKEEASYKFLKPRVFYKLTDKGRTEVAAWQNPVKSAHPEFG